jgi:hypothetical protein
MGIPEKCKICKTEKATGWFHQKPVCVVCFKKEKQKQHTIKFREMKQLI